MSIAILAPEWIDEQNKCLAIIRENQDTLPVMNQLVRFREMIDTSEDWFCKLIDSTGDSPPIVVWPFVCRILEAIEEARWVIRKSALSWLSLPLLSKSIREIHQELRSQSIRLIELMRFVLVSRPDWNLTVPVDLERVIWTVHISPFAYLRAMANLFWSAIRHPFSDTTIDLSTGRVLYHN